MKALEQHMKPANAAASIKVKNTRPDKYTFPLTQTTQTLTFKEIGSTLQLNVYIQEIKHFN